MVGGGYLGLWTALLAKERDPSPTSCSLEAATCGQAASGRNGGFCEASLTHGFGNGMARWPDEMPELLAMGRENLAGIEDTVRRHGIDCDFQRNGSLAVANAAAPGRTRCARSTTRCASSGWTRPGCPPTRSAPGSTHRRSWRGDHDPDGAIVEPARLAWGLRRACLAPASGSSSTPGPPA